MRNRAESFLLLLALGAAALLGGCRGGGNKYVPPPPPDVTVTQAVEQETTIWVEFTGTMTPLFSVDLRARVKGFLQSVNFKPGSVVNKGDLLFVIEPEPYEAALKEAEANVESAKATLQQAEVQLEITQAMANKGASSKIDLATKLGSRDTAKADLLNKQAALEDAKINYGYTHIYAPITGRVNRNLVDVGNLVGASEDTLLATIVQDDPIYAYFNLSEQQLLEHMEQRRKAEASGDKEKGKTPIYVGLATEEGYPHAGEFDYADNRVDPSTGTIQVRGIFPNPGHVLLGGLFARIRLPGWTGRAALVPEESLSADQAGRFVLVVNDKNVVEHRAVDAGPVVDGGMRVVAKGLAAGEWIVVQGLQRARPGGTVNPQKKTAPPSAPTQPSN